MTNVKAQQQVVTSDVEASTRRAEEVLPSRDIAIATAERAQPIVDASKAAVQTAALIPKPLGEREKISATLYLYRMEGGVVPIQKLYDSAGNGASSASTLVHERLEADPETLMALDELGLRSASPETAFKDLASTLLSRPGAPLPEIQWVELWQLANDIPQSASAGIISAQRQWRDALRVRTMAGSWASLFGTMLPGHVVSADGGRDSSVAIDTRFHEANLPLLRLLGARTRLRLGCHSLSVIIGHSYLAVDASSLNRNSHITHT